MSRTFDPWIGPKYETEGLDGLKLLILGESHYGTASKETRGFTQDVVQRLGQKQRHRFFTTTTKVVLGLGSSHIGMKRRAYFWDQVAFCNFIQSFVTKNAKSRSRPTDEMWRDAEAVFQATISEIKPDAILVLGVEMGRRLPALPASIQIHSIQHPSRYFRYADWMPGVQRFLASAVQ